MKYLREKGLFHDCYETHKDRTGPLASRATFRSLLESDGDTDVHAFILITASLLTALVLLVGGTTNMALPQGLLVLLGAVGNSPFIARKWYGAPQVFEELTQLVGNLREAELALEVIIFEAEQRPTTMQELVTLAPSETLALLRLVLDIRNLVKKAYPEDGVRPDSFALQTSGISLSLEALGAQRESGDKA